MTWCKQLKQLSVDGTASPCCTNVLYSLYTWACCHCVQNEQYTMSDPEGNSKFCFPESHDVSLEEIEGNTRGGGGGGGGVL